MPGDTTRIPLAAWRRELVRATVLAYRRGKADGLTETQCADRAEAAYVGAGGDPEAVRTDLYKIISAAARDHGEWFWRPVRDRLERHERYLRHIGMWPPPKIEQDWPRLPDDFP